MRTSPNGGRFPARAEDLIFGPPDRGGQRVINNRRTGQYFRLGEEEQFLLEQLDGKRSPKHIQRAYHDQFGERLAKDELLGFLDLATKKGLLESKPTENRARNGHAASRPSSTTDSANGRDRNETAAQPPRPRSSSGSLLFWRKPLFDPDRLLDWLAPKIGFFWTPAFLVASLLSILAAVGVLVANQGLLVSTFHSGQWWRTGLCALITLLAVTMLHEFAHGLTCKRHGGQVHEIGFLLLFFMPALFCNVSDAWLFPQKSKRLWVTFAGGYFELFLWSLAVFVWRLTMQDTLVNYLAWMVVTISGVRVLFNFNPLLKLDGYYLLSDAVGVANLREASIGRLMGWLRSLLWGAPRPSPVPHAKFLVVYGLASWAFSVVFLSLMVWAMGHWLAEHVGGPGIAIALLVGVQAGRGMFGGLLSGELSNMASARPVRLLVWIGSMVAVVAGLSMIRFDERAKGNFEVRPSSRIEVRAPVAGFLASVAGDEGDKAGAGCVVARLSIPDLASRMKEKEAELREADAKLTLLQTGARREEIDETRARLARAGQWRDRAQADLARNQQALGQDLQRLDQKIQENRLEVEATEITLRRAQNLVRDRVISQQQYLELDKNYRVAASRLQQAIQERNTRASLGTLDAENELGRRERELADANAALELLLAGSRREEIDAARASRARAQEELKYLHEQQRKLDLCTPVPGVIVTHRLKEKIGQFFAEGALVCEVEGLSQLETEITLPEQEVPHVRPGQKVELKARALPFKTFEARVDRIAPRAKSGTEESTVIVYCRLEHPDPELLPGMTGFARIYCDPQPAGRIFLDKVMRFVRTEFWW